MLVVDPDCEVPTVVVDPVVPPPLLDVERFDEAPDVEGCEVFPPDEPFELEPPLSVEEESVVSAGVELHALTSVTARPMSEVRREIIATW